MSYIFIIIIYANMIFIFIFKRLSHMQFKIKLYFWKKDFLLFFSEWNWFTWYWKSVSRVGYNSKY